MSEAFGVTFLVTFVIPYAEDDNRFRLGFRYWGEFGISRTYFSDGTDDEEVFDLWREEHKHCFVWRRRPDEFKVPSLVKYYTLMWFCH